MPQKKWSVDEVVERLVQLSKVIECRRGLKPQQEVRVDDAFSIIASGHCTAKKRPYLEFLQLVHARIGHYGVVVCAAFGATSLSTLRDHERVQLAVRVEEKKEQIANQQLQALADKYTDKRR